MGILASLSGPGVPLSLESVDLSEIADPWTHWRCAEDIVHEAQTVPRLEPGLEQWLPLWLHWRPHLSEIRAAVASEIANLVVDAED